MQGGEEVFVLLVQVGALADERLHNLFPFGVDGVDSDVQGSVSAVGVSEVDDVGGEVFF